MVTNTRRRPVARPRCEIVPKEGDAFGWRLLAANGRPLGASTVGYPDEAAAGEAFHALVRAPKLECEVGHHDGAVHWSWIAFDPDGVPVAASARRYDRRGSCENSFQQFLDVLGTFAPLDEG